MLTAKQEKFCTNIVEGMTQYKAYIDAYDTDPNRDRQRIDTDASELASTPKISQRIQELRDKVADKLVITVDKLIKELEVVKGMTLTQENPDYANHIKSIQEQGKLCGLYVSKTEDVTDYSDKLKELEDKAK